MASNAAAQQEQRRTWDIKTIAVVIGLVVMIVGWGITWGTSENRLAETERRSVANEVQIKQIEGAWVEIRVALARIESDVAHIRETMEREAP